MNPTDQDRDKAAELIPCHPFCARDGDAYDEFHCDCGAWEMQQVVAQALADERERVLTVRRALIDDDRCACEDCIREELATSA